MNSRQKPDRRKNGANPTLRQDRRSALMPLERSDRERFSLGKGQASGSQEPDILVRRTKTEMRDRFNSSHARQLRSKSVLAGEVIGKIQEDKVGTQGPDGISVLNIGKGGDATDAARHGRFLRIDAER